MTCLSVIGTHQTSLGHICSLGIKSVSSNRQSHKHLKTSKESSLRPPGTRKRKPGTLADFSASQDHMVSHSCICLWTSFLFYKAVHVFLSVILVYMCWLLTCELMFLMFLSFDCGTCVLSLDSSGYSLIGWVWGRYAPSSNWLWPRRVRAHLPHTYVQVPWLRVSATTFY